MSLVFSPAFHDEERPNTANRLAGKLLTISDSRHWAPPVGRVAESASHEPRFTPKLGLPELFLRPNLGWREERLPFTGIPQSCPDIIPLPFGEDPSRYRLSDPGTRGVDPAVRISRAQRQHIYVRAWTHCPTRCEALVQLFSCPGQLIAWPSLWRKRRLTAASENAQPYAHMASSAYEVALTGEPFLYEPSELECASDHQTYVALLASRHSPEPLPYQPFVTYERMAALVNNTHSIGWRNVHMVEPEKRDRWSYRTQLSIPHNVPPGVFHIFLEGDQLTTGAEVAFECETRQELGVPLKLDWTRIGSPDQIQGVSVTLPPGFQGTITTHYRGNGVVNRPGASLRLRADMEAGSRPWLLRLVQPEHAKRLWKGLKDRPVFPVSLGSVEYRF